MMKARNSNKVNVDNLNNELVGFENKAKDISKIYDFLVQNLSEVNFKDELDSEREGKVLRKEKVVIVINKILEKSEELELGLFEFKSQIYVFNKAYWEVAEHNAFKEFLSRSAIKLGLHCEEADYYGFKNDLYEQFRSKAFKKLENDNDIVLINFRNGTLEIKNGNISFKDFDKNDLLTYQLHFDYDLNSDMPIFRRFLNEVLPDENLQKILSEYLGSIFIPKQVLKLEKMLILYGSGSNGKSVIFDIIENLLGRHNVTHYTLKKLTTDANIRAQLQNKLINYSSEVSEVGDVDMFKNLASREPVEVKLLYKDGYNIYNYAKLMFNSNDLPSVNEITKGYFRRYLIIPFEQFIPEEKQDKKLATKIINSELPAIFNWIIEGMYRLLENKDFTFSEKIEAIQKEYEKESDSVGLFIEEQPLMLSENYTTLKQLYSYYRTFCFQDGHKPCSKTTFSKRLVHHGFDKKRIDKGIAFNAEIKIL